MRSEREKPVSLVKNLAFEHGIDEFLKALNTNRRERISRLEPRLQMVPREAALLEDERHDLVGEHVHRMCGGLHVFDPTSLGETMCGGADAVCTQSAAALYYPRA
jgi:hypothetical protein